MTWNYYVIPWSDIPTHHWVPGKRFRVRPWYKLECMRNGWVA